MRVKIILIAILLILSIGATVVAAVAAVQDYQSFQAQNASIAVGDVRAIRPWMTIPYIAHLCHVPESYLYQSLNITDTHPPRHITLHALAILKHTSVDAIVYRVQQAIDLYRQQHPKTETHLQSCLVLPGEIRYSVSRRICT
jgi:hypothetical protein